MSIARTHHGSSFQVGRVAFALVCLTILPPLEGCFPREYRQAEIYREAGDVEAAAQAYDQALERKPSLAAAYLRKATLFAEVLVPPDRDRSLDVLNAAITFYVDPANEDDREKVKDDDWDALTTMRAEVLGRLHDSAQSSAREQEDGSLLIAFCDRHPGNEYTLEAFNEAFAIDLDHARQAGDPDVWQGVLNRYGDAVAPAPAKKKKKSSRRGRRSRSSEPTTAPAPRPTERILMEKEAGLAEARREVDRLAWEAHQGDEARVRRFIATYTESSHLDEAQDWIRDLEDAQYAPVKKTESEAEIEAFVRDHPSNRHVDAARKRLDDLRWNVAKADQDVREIRAFVRRYPDSRHVKGAERLIEDIRFEFGAAARDVDRLQAYLDDYPKGRHRKKARAAIERIEFRPIRENISASVVSVAARSRTQGEYSEGTWVEVKVRLHNGNREAVTFDAVVMQRIAWQQVNRAFIFTNTKEGISIQKKAVRVDELGAGKSTTIITQMYRVEGTNMAIGEFAGATRSRTPIGDPVVSIRLPEDDD